MVVLGFSSFPWFMLSASSFLSTLAVQFPYIPAHVTKVKEEKRLYIVQLPEKGRHVISKWGL